MNLQSICENLGKNNSAVKTVVAVAIFKGIFRPLFTMCDKKQDPKSKEYAAIREGATEIIAIPTYIALAKITEKFAPKFALDKSIKGNFTNPGKALNFVGVCAAALFVIPGLCSVAMPHILKLFKAKTTNSSPVNSVQNVATKPVIKISAKQIGVEKPSIYNTNLYGKVSMNTSRGMTI